MDGLKFTIKEEDARSLRLELLIKILATQKAAVDVMILMCATGENEEAKKAERDFMVAVFDHKTQVYSDMIFAAIYEEKGELNLDEIMKQTPHDGK